MEGRGIRASVRLRFGFQFLHDFHLLEVHHTDGVVMSVGGVELLEFRDVLHSFRTRRVRYRSNNFVGAEVDDVGLSCGEMRGQQVVIVLIYREVVEALSARAGQVKLRDLFERLCVCAFGENVPASARQT